MSVKGTFFIILVFQMAISTNFFGQEIPLPKKPELKTNSTISLEDFIEGKTTIGEIIYTGLDDSHDESDYLIRSVPLSDLLRELRENRTSIEVNDKFDSRKVEKTIKVTSRFLFDLGFLNAKVIAFGEKLPKDRMKLILSVEKGTLVEISRFHFNGTRFFTNPELEGALISCLGDEWRTSDWRKIKFCVDRDVRGFMFSRGFFKAKINHIGRRFIDRNLEIGVNISEGTVHRYGEITVEGTKVFSAAEILEIFGSKSGDIANGKNVQSFAYEKLPKLYGDRGYLHFSAEFDPELIESTSKELDSIVNIKFTLYEGPRFKVAAVDFTGLSQEESRDLMVDFPLQIGDFFSKGKFENWCKRINETDKYYYLDSDQDVELLTHDKKADIYIVIKISKKQ